MRDLGTLSGYPHGQVNAVNNFGQAVGVNITGVLADVPAFAAWDIGGCGVRNLYSYLPPTEGYRFFLMTGISETQYISLSAFQGGTTDGDVHAFLMVPQ